TGPDEVQPEGLVIAPDPGLDGDAERAREIETLVDEAICRKEGETEIKFWHEKDVGFMGRKPLSVSDESLV
ncbi:MAG: DUF2203 family protein, partial [Nitrososphaerota archaeon]|nr:DUF2203 family protein [Nitrososphaerota archaeon]